MSDVCSTDQEPHACKGNWLMGFVRQGCSYLVSSFYKWKEKVLLPVSLYFRSGLT